ncbi:hypothetical protein SLEP1_g22681 [Rubroshorea leprosula]|uniref:Transposase (putative) gypsy type domain-containing protein n=1 Tax=Rubroshorea leprosula TaxID=152421 RepID=A0AAV5JH88_9ROSI|nr:hypothetical protein SLEP1_g22681 [Rubroshorea leprosula]
MEFFRELRELWVNQGREEEKGVMSVEPIAMIVPSKLRDLLETIMPESNASSSADGDSSGHHSSPSNSSSSKRTPNDKGNEMEAPQNLPARFRFRVALHHEVAYGTSTIKGYKKLEEMVKQYHIPKTILLQIGTRNKWECSVSGTGWVPIYVDHFDGSLRFPLPELIFDVLAKYKLTLTQLTPNSIKFIIGFMLLCARFEILAKVKVFRLLFQCWLSSNQTRCYYISGREKMMLFKNIRNKVARWKRQFIFVHDTRIEKMNNELAAHIFEWCIANTYMNYPQLTPHDVDLKNQLLDYVKAEGLVDLKSLITSEQLIVFGSSQQERGSSLASRPRVKQRVDIPPSNSRRRAHDGSNAEDDMPLIRQRTSFGAQLVLPTAVHSFNVPLASARDVGKALPMSASALGPRIAYPEGFSYTRTDSKVAMVFSYVVALFECEQGAHRQTWELTESCKQLTFEKASLEDEVNRLQSFEMANRAAFVES